MLAYKILETESKKLLAVVKTNGGISNAVMISDLEYRMTLISLLALEGDEDTVLALMEGLI